MLCCNVIGSRRWRGRRRGLSGGTRRRRWRWMSCLVRRCWGKGRRILNAELSDYAVALTGARRQASIFSIASGLKTISPQSGHSWKSRCGTVNGLPRRRRVTVRRTLRILGLWHVGHVLKSIMFVIRLVWPTPGNSMSRSPLRPPACPWFRLARR